jgi:3-isopropylmalate dehydrogenase
MANPIATILSVAMMLRYSLGQPEAAAAIEKAVNQVLEAGIRTADLAPTHQPVVDTKAMTNHILSALHANLHAN